ncbi:hypothetical protein A2803_01860 [Candidatus Woesebacteria bacterium RIFCSPHIGHO2_01_FULL_44_21]|uniref:Uncharacterized protein n=1 Tax=Candidatus Woesebacteria bacterium RIFCSPHIGHO2_01_FULL_44_21 TaxID=1802503 RepID=A0A1F7YVF7_9BACT|nr:MAG: hypothetical protein A2803_01860 [Candidatus Woesebacteria bacterium RIFCSPHIGHO2_01_FULL_44_21]OGM69617.1 MAG: hypothetical protein A2897_03375 [Candidatus Woesebacteria bacterium RIFCSPLOWO2_01_FULL_44_24b]
MSKRHKFLITSLVLSLGFFGITFLENEDRLVGIAALSLGSIIMFFWTLREGIKRDATLLCLILPPLFTLGVGLFWFLLPSTFYARLPIIVLYGIGVYSIALTANVLTVSVLKKIALARAAKGVSFVLTLFTLFLLYDAVLSLKASIFIASSAVLVASFPLFLQGLWVSRITKEVGSEILIYSGVFSYVVGGVAVLMYFWPVSVVVGSLFLTVVVYILLGLGQAKIEARLFRQTVNEYLTIGTIVFLIMLLSTNWHG